MINDWLRRWMILLLISAACGFDSMIVVVANNMKKDRIPNNCFTYLAKCEPSCKGNLYRCVYNNTFTQQLGQTTAVYCCQHDPVGAIVAGIVCIIIVCVITAVCCYWCPGCPGYKSRHPVVYVAGTPGQALKPPPTAIFVNAPHSSQHMLLKTRKSDHR